jgi:hypothetical protein
LRGDVVHWVRGGGSARTHGCLEYFFLVVCFIIIYFQSNPAFS